MTDLAPDIDFGSIPNRAVIGLPELVVELQAVPLDVFADVNEPGADPLVGEGDDALIPEDGDVMVYGDGGAGKTTLCIDLACHLAAGDDWLGMPVARPVRVLLVENEGPRPLFRQSCAASSTAGRVRRSRIASWWSRRPGRSSSFADEACRERSPTRSASTSSTS